MKKKRNCLNKGIRILKYGLMKATSYDMVKSRLNYRWYNSELLEQRNEYVNLEINKNK
jgi:hypothetical protein